MPAPEVPKTDNRPQAIRAADLARSSWLRMRRLRACFQHDVRGQIRFPCRGALQTGSWGALTQRAGAAVGEVGWQPAVSVLKPWVSIRYSYGSGDGNPNDSTHGTFFQVLTTPRQYARFPFYNMMNNGDAERHV